MKQRMSNVEREFSPKEAEKITGVSTTLQRDWRRREILPQKREAGWAKFGLSDLIEMMVIKSFSEAGFSVQAAREISSLSVLPSLRAINKFPGTFEFDGDPIDESHKQFIIDRSVHGGNERYLVMAMSKQHNEPDVARMGTLEYIEEFLARNQAVHCTVVDCERIAKTIVDRAGLPLTRVEVENINED